MAAEVQTSAFVLRLNFCTLAQRRCFDCRNKINTKTLPAILPINRANKETDD